MRKCAINAVALLFSVIFTVGYHCRAQNSQPTEYQIKAAFIYNFARFVDWPTQAFTDASSPLIIGVLGKNDFGSSLKETIDGKTIRGHPLEFKLFPSLARVANCQVLFISTSEKNHLSKIISTLRTTSILTVGETDDFVARGGMIRLRIVDDKVRFDINNSAAKSAGLTISSKLLTLAIDVR
ncbi:MAG TPA: YfiR family protein [Candidatus Sulfotelmatobacter sp.]|nr:YfiR family protein [Candidatus Sulfotelmatobacter sp.]